MTATTARGPRGPLVAALLLRLALPLVVLGVTGGDWSLFTKPDTNTYLTPARHLLERGEFSSLSGPEIFRTPGYPLVLALGLLAGQPILVTLLLQALAGTLTVWCIMRTASLLFGEDDGGPARRVRTCGWLAACEPLSLLCGALVLADALLATAISIAVLLLLTHFRRPSTRTALALGVTLAAAAYIKPVAYYLPALLLPWLWLSQRGPTPASSVNRELTLPRRAGGALENRRRLSVGFGSATPGSSVLIVAATVAILVGAWQVRNGVQTGFWGFSTLTARAVYVAAGGGVTAARDGRAFGDVREERLEQAAIRTSREPLHIGDMYRRGLSDVIGSPVTAAAVHVKGMLLTLFDPASLDYLRLFGAYPAISPVTRFGNQGLAATIATIARAYPAVLWCSLLLEAILLAYLALAARGAWRAALRHGLPEARSLLLIAAYFLVLSGGIFGAARFRLPIMPVMILLGGYALACQSPHPSPLPAGRARGRRPDPVGYTDRA